jgi:N-acylneuraminate cytidylyltransferase
MTCVCCIIPARGGSKGIPGKNLALVAGRPLLAHTVEIATTSTRVTKALVSTDSANIADLARALGAQPVDRPADLSGDTAPSEKALLHALDWWREQNGADPDLVVFLQATSPLRPPGAIDDAIALLEREYADSLFSAGPVHGFVWRQHEGSLRSITYDHHHRPRRQDIGHDWLENGSIYIFKPWVLRETGNRLGGKVVVFPMHPLDSFQVDEPEDLALFESLFALRGAAQLAPPREALAAVRLLVLDFDGVMTDDRVWVDQDGRESVACSRSDGMGIERLKQAGLEVVVLSKETNPVVAARCRKLNIACSQGVDEKLPTLARLVAERGLDPLQVAYLGNDVNDMPPLSWVGMPIAVADARPEAAAVARWRTSKAGGSGAVREVCEWLISANVRTEHR